MASDSNTEGLMLSPRPKRRREDNAPDEITKHESLYFEDGDIVLMSLPKDDVITAFRVDKVFLSRHSPVFKDMFSFPSPDKMERHDGVPLVRLQDEAEHLVSFLKALYDPSTIPYEKHHRDTVDKVEGTLKLCTKYQIDGLRQRIIDHLSADWPNTLSAWDAAELEILVKATKEDFQFVDNILPEPCSVIRLARECNIPQLLRAAFYHLSRIPLHTDTSATNSDDAYVQYLVSGGRTAEFTLLTCDDFMCLLRGTRAMADHVHDALHTTLKQAKSKCRAPVCESLPRYSKELELNIFHKSDPLSTLSLSKFEKDAPDTVCKYCREFFQKSMLRTRSELWEKLPTNFGFEAD